MDKKRLENTQLEIVHQVGGEDRMKVKTKLPEFGVERVLRAHVNDRS